MDKTNATRVKPLAGKGIAFIARHESQGRWAMLNLNVVSVADETHAVQITARIDDGKVGSSRARSCYAGLELGDEDARALAAELLKGLK